jgi:hypothetical protein
MSGAAALLAKLRGIGAHDSFGRFTLDCAKAREKMRMFQLEDPHYYVLELAQAAVASGARRITVYCDADDFHIDFDGETFAREELRNLFSSLFISQKDASRERFRELALGVNCALALRPSFVQVDSGDTRLRIERTREIVTQLPQNSPGTSVWVKDRISWRMVKRFFSMLQGLPIEGKILQDRCRFCNVPFEINGTAINSNPVLEHMIVEGAFAEPDCSGLIGLPYEPPDESNISFIRLGVLLTSHKVKLPSVQSSAFVRWDRAVKNVSQSDVVKDRSYASIIRIVRTEGEKLLEGLAALYADEKDETRRAACRAHFLRYLEGHVRADAYSARVKRLKRVIASVALFTMSQGPPVSCEDLMGIARERGYVPYIVEGLTPGEVIAEGPVVIGSARDVEVLKAVFKGRVRDMWEEMQKEARRKTSIVLWKPAPVALAPHLAESRVKPAPAEPQKRPAPAPSPAEPQREHDSTPKRKPAAGKGSAVRAKVRREKEETSAMEVAEALERRAKAPDNQEHPAREDQAAPLYDAYESCATTGLPLFADPPSMPAEHRELLRALRERFIVLRGAGEMSVTDVLLAHLTVEAVSPSLPAIHDPESGTTVVNCAHEAVASIMKRWKEEPVLLAYLASSVYSAVNRAYAPVTDEMEAAFQMRLLRL